ncbi:hypothetical protein IFM89_000120 [Coptis chinensis]|uniref:Transcription initiation factor IIF subunit alpha n=1 Tax=Coptis chinensis TaxID=261450 RepID=A0A835I0J8_9MAGN|nr:hypothetical protein IFM89_000120 [Coptis chinensis]
MSFDLHLKPQCGGCGSQKDLYGSNCKHLTLCINCGKKMAENRNKCYDCGVPVTRLIREYNVRTNASTEKNYFIGRFVSGLPFSKKKNAEKWCIQKEGLQGRNVTDALREKYKNKPWLLEDETGQFQYHGQLEGSQSATYYLLVMQQGKEFVAIPAGSCLINLRYNFNKVAQYKQLTLEEAEEKMKNRRKTADGYQRWMMKAANNGPAAFGETEKFDEKDTGGATGRGNKKATADDDEGNASDRGEEDEEEEEGRKNRLGLNKKGGDDDGEGRRGGDLDLDDDDIEKGDDWEHEEIFTDDDEAVGNDPEEREDLAPEVPAPPEIKQDEEDDDDEADEEEGGLSKSGKELKKLLGKTGGLNDSDAEDEDDDDDVVASADPNHSSWVLFMTATCIGFVQMDDEIGMSPVLAPKQKDTPKEEPIDNSPSKTVAGSVKGTPSAPKSAKAKRKSGGDDTKSDSKSSTKDGSASAPRGGTVAQKGSASSIKTESESPVGPVTEDEIRAVLLQKSPVTTQDLVAKFKSRLKGSRDKAAFADILKKISKIQKVNGSSFVVLREK